MPAATTYWTDLDHSGQIKLAQAAREELDARAKMFGKNWDYYDGKHPKPLKPPANGSRFDDNVIINCVRQNTEQTVSFAAGAWPSIELDDGGEKPTAETNADEATEQTISDFWKEIGEASWLSSLMQIGCLTGHLFVLISPPEPGEMPELYILNPANMLCYWTEDDYETIRWYEQRYIGHGEKRKRDFIAPGVADNATWQIRTYAMRGNNWQPIQDTPDDPFIINWEYENPPIIDWQHLPRPLRYYGDHEVNTASNDSINKVASDMKKIIRHHSSPRIFGTGFASGTLQDTGIDSFYSVEAENAKVMMLEMQSDMASSMNYLNLLLGIDRLQARVTILTGGPDAYKGVTNLGIKAAFMNQLAKTETLHRQYGWGLAQLTVAAMEMLGQSIEEPLIKWQPALPTSDMEETQVAQTQHDMGVLSKQTAAGELGLDWQLEQERIADEQDQAASVMDRLMGAPLPFNTPQDNMRMNNQNMRNNGNGSA